VGEKEKKMKVFERNKRVKSGGTCYSSHMIYDQLFLTYNDSYGFPHVHVKKRVGFK